MEPSYDHVPAGHGSPVVESELLYGSEEGKIDENEAKIQQMTALMIDMHRQIEEAKALRTPPAAKKPAAKVDTQPGTTPGREKIAPQMLQNLGIEDSEGAALEAQMDHYDEMYEKIAGVVNTSDGLKVLFDGGAYKHLFGTGVDHLIHDRQTVERPVCVQTAQGVMMLREVGKLVLGKHTFEGYLNPNMGASLLSEGLLRQQNWKFWAASKKVVESLAGPFYTDQRGTLDFWPVAEVDGVKQLLENPEGTTRRTRTCGCIRMLWEKLNKS